jgi:hypothetical protein
MGPLRRRVRRGRMIRRVWRLESCKARLFDNNVVVNDEPARDDKTNGVPKGFM